jgi:DivIVA domain-containing protein
VLAFLLSVIGVLVVGGLLFLGGSLLLGRGETQPPAELDRSPMELPDDRPVVGDDIRALRISPAVRGYRMTEVDWLLDQFAQTLDERDQEIARLRARLAAAPDAARPERQEPVEHRAEPEPAHDAPADGEPADGAVPGSGPAGDEERRHA